jgi:hypothetical protein
MIVDKKSLSADCSSAYLRIPTANLLELPLSLKDRIGLIVLLYSLFIHIILIMRMYTKTNEFQLHKR